MPDPPDATDRIALLRAQFAAEERRDLDAVGAFYASDAVWDLTDIGLGLFVGVAAIREMVGDWWATWEQRSNEIEEVADLGRGVVFAVVAEDGRAAGSDRHVRQRRGRVVLFAGDRIERVTVYMDVEHARAAARALAASRSQR